MKNVFYTLAIIAVALFSTSCTQSSKNKTLVTELSYPYYESIILIFDDGVSLSSEIQQKEAKMCEEVLKLKVSNFPVGDKKMNGTIYTTSQKMVFVDEYVALSNDSIFSTRLLENETSITRIKKVLKIEKQDNQIKVEFMLANGCTVSEVKNL